MEKCGCSENLACGCCAGIEPLTPQPTANRPGLSALACRVGTHSAFLKTMQARLSNFYFETSSAAVQESAAPQKIYPLQNLKARAAPDDFSIALFDAAATLLDVLTFYQERIINEGYLRTATERRSILELARLVGYAPRPGVAASVYFAYTLDDKSEPVEIPAGARAQSVPAPDELPQSFETTEKIEARREWNNLAPRRSRPQRIRAKTAEVIYLAGTETNLKPNDALLFVFEESRRRTPELRKVKTIEPLFAEQKTKITLQLALDFAAFQDNIREIADRYQSNFQAFCIADRDDLTRRAAAALPILVEADERSLPSLVVETLNLLQKLKDEAAAGGRARTRRWLGKLADELTVNLRALENFDENRLNDSDGSAKKDAAAFRNLVNLVKPLSLSPSPQLANRLLLKRDAKKVFDIRQDTLPQILTAFNPRLGTSAYQAWANTDAAPVAPLAVYALRVNASLFGNTAPRRVLKTNRDTGRIEETGEPLIVERLGGHGETLVKNEDAKTIFLDSSYDRITPDSWVVLDTTEVEKDGLKNFKLARDVLITRAGKVSPALSRAAYGISGKTTRLNLKDAWGKFLPDAELKESPAAEFQFIRRAVVHAQSELLPLAEEPIEEDVCGSRIELGALYHGLQTGRWLIVCGERTDIDETRGVKACELVMLAGVEQSYDPALPGDKIHTTLVLFNSLAYTYKRDTVTIYGNVVKATHGETRSEVLGSGDATKALAAFLLKQPPLTYISAPTPRGIESTLRIRVNEVEWTETESLADLKPADRKFITKTDDEAKTTVVFGNGEQGARLPTGIENVKAIYRSGIGKSGNVKAGQISLLLDKPLGVREVINPLRAAGGADKETRDQARRNVPIALLALDRLVSTKDYADFARTFAGVGKASAARLADGRRRLVYLTIAGAEDIPLDVNSDLYQNLRRALAKYGDAFQPVQIMPRELLALVIAANVRILPAYRWETVVVKLRAALLENFSFERRELGQSVFLSEVVSVMQRVEGVVFVDVETLDGISETELGDENLLDRKLKNLADVGLPNQFVRVRAARVETDALTGKKKILPAQLAYLTPFVPDTLIINRIDEVKR